MDRKAQMDRLVWLSTTDIKARKLYAWQTAQALDAAYPGISEELKQRMTGLAVNSVSVAPTQTKPR